MNRLTVLYVEDEELIRRLFSRFLANHADSVFTARDGVEGLKTFIAIQPDLVITDISMPNLDGLQMAERIRTIQPAIPIVFLTASPERLAEFSGFDPAKDRVLAKPVDSRLIGELLKKYAMLSTSARADIPGAAGQSPHLGNQRDCFQVCGATG